MNMLINFSSRKTNYPLTSYYYKITTRELVVRKSRLVYLCIASAFAFKPFLASAFLSASAFAFCVCIASAFTFALAKLAVSFV